MFNGDTGIIEEINDFAETITVNFDEGRMVEYSYKLLDELELAYAVTIHKSQGSEYQALAANRINKKSSLNSLLITSVTIHKSQGSEYPAVVMPLVSGASMLMTRNLLYTGVTRAKKCVTIVGDDTTFEQMIENNSQQRRYSGLKDRLLENKEEA